MVTNNYRMHLPFSFISDKCSTSWGYREFFFNKVKKNTHQKLITSISGPCPKLSPNSTSFSDTLSCWLTTRTTTKLDQKPSSAELTSPFYLIEHKFLSKCNKPASYQACLEISIGYLKAKISWIYWCNSSTQTCMCVCVCWGSENSAPMWQLTQWKQIAMAALQLSITSQQIEGTWGLRVSAVAACRHKAPGPAITVS